MLNTIGNKVSYFKDCINDILDGKELDEDEEN